MLVDVPLRFQISSLVTVCYDAKCANYSVDRQIMGLASDNFLKLFNPELNHGPKLTFIGKGHDIQDFLYYLRRNCPNIKVDNEINFDVTSPPE